MRRYLANMEKQNFHAKLIALLKNNPDYVDDEAGKLLRARLPIDDAYQLDHNLIRLLSED